MTASNPSYRLTLGSTTVDSSQASSADPLVRLATDADLETPAAALELAFGRPQGISVAPGDRARLELGDGSALYTVFNGTVDRVEAGLERLRVTALSAVIRLLRLYVNQVYENQTAGGVVADLAAQAGVPTAAVDDGLDLPVYVVEDRRSAFHQCRDLAERAGFDLYSTPEDELTFAAFAKAAPDHVLRYGRDLLAAWVAVAAPSAGRVEVWGESPASAEGAEAASWLTHDFSSARGSAGSGSLRRFDDPAIRTRDAAAASAEGRLTALGRRASFGATVALGAARVALGDAVSLIEAPGDRLGGLFQVRRVSHRLSARRGFTTRLELRAAGAVGGVS